MLASKPKHGDKETMEVEVADVEGVDIRDVTKVNSKIEKTLMRLDAMKRWNPIKKLEYLRTKGLKVLQDQLRFLLKVQALKELRGICIGNELKGGVVC